MEDSYYDRVTFSEGTDCEDCGWYPDDISVSSDGDGSWYVHRSIGCYGGFAEDFETVALAVARIEEFRDEELTGKQNKRFRREVNEMISGMLEFDSNRRTFRG